MKRLLMVVVVCAMTFAAFAQTDVEVVIASSGDVTVTDTELEAAIESLPDEIRPYAEGPGKKSFVEDLLRMKRLAKAAEDSGVADQPEVKAQLELNRANTLANAQVEAMRESITVDEERVSKLYEERKGQFERAKARHILIAFQGSPAAGENAPTEDEAKAEAEALLEKIEAGADFATVAQEESDDKGSGARGGELGEFTRGQMVPEFENAVFSAEPGTLAPLVRTQFGYHIIEVQERATMPLEAVRAEIESELRQQILQQQIEGFDEGAVVTFNEDYFDSDVPKATTDEDGA